MSPVETTDHFYRAIINKRVVNVCSSYMPSKESYVILEGPRCTTLGFEKISKGWWDFWNSPLTLNKIEWVEGPFGEVSSDKARVGGMVVLNVELKGKEFTVQFLSTFSLLKNQENIW